MRALRHKSTGEWLHQITATGGTVVGTIPKVIYDPTTLKTVKIIEQMENNHRAPGQKVDLSDYELVEIEIVVTKVIDSNE